MAEGEGKIGREMEEGGRVVDLPDSVFEVDLSVEEVVPGRSIRV